MYFVYEVYMKKAVLTLLISVTLLSCSTSTPQPQDPVTVSNSPTNDVTSKATKQAPSNNSTETTEPTQTTIDKYGCDNPLLTPEEVANCGQHTYSVEGNQVEGDCYYKLEDGSRVHSFSKKESYTITFDSGTVKTIGKNSESVSIQISPNTYEFREDDTITLTTFTLDGWIDEFTWDSCKDIEVATIIK
jgi:hypothetical protein